MHRILTGALMLVPKALKHMLSAVKVKSMISHLDYEHVHLIFHFTTKSAESIKAKFFE